MNKETENRDNPRIKQINFKAFKENGFIFLRVWKVNRWLQNLIDTTTHMEKENYGWLESFLPLNPHENSLLKPSLEIIYITL